MWRDEYKLGHDGIDEQHREIFQRTDEVRRVLHDASPEALIGLITSTADYVEEHFRYEEDLMKRIGYPDRERHASIHDTFRAEIKERLRVLHSGGGLNRKRKEKFLQEMVGWLTFHLQVEDRRVVAFDQDSSRKRA